MKRREPRQATEVGKRQMPKAEGAVPFPGRAPLRRARVMDPAKFKVTGFEVPAHTRMLVVRESDDTLKILHEETGESRRVKLDRQGQVLSIEKLS